MFVLFIKNTAVIVTYIQTELKSTKLLNLLSDMVYYGSPKYYYGFDCLSTTYTFFPRHPTSMDDVSLESES